MDPRLPSWLRSEICRRQDELEREELLASLRLHRDSRFPVGTRLKRCEICRKIEELAQSGVPLWELGGLYRNHDRSILGHHGPLPLWMFRVEGGAPSTFWIDPAGSDSTGDGSQSSPWLTFGKAKASMIAGDILKVNPGTYTANNDWSLSSKAGTAANVFTAEAADSADKPIIKPNGGTRVLYLDRGSNYWTFTNIIFDGLNVGFDTAKIDRAGDGTTNIVSVGCVYRNSPDNQGYLTTADCDDHTMTDTQFNGNGSSDLDHGIYLQSDGHALLRCSADQNAGYGFHLFSSTNNCTLDRCLATANNQAAGNGANFILAGTGNVVRNFIGVDSATGFQTQGGTAGSPNKILNALAYNATDYGYILRGHVHLKNVVLRTATSYSVQEKFTDGSSVLTTATNKFQADSDPQWVNPGASNFHLQGSSPLIDAGTDLSGEGVTVDYDANVRSGTWDIGPFESTPVLVSVPAGSIAMAGQMPAISQPPTSVPIPMASLQVSALAPSVVGVVSVMVLRHKRMRRLSDKYTHRFLSRLFPFS